MSIRALRSDRTRRRSPGRHRATPSARRHDPRRPVIKPTLDLLEPRILLSNTLIDDDAHLQLPFEQASTGDQEHAPNAAEANASLFELDQWYSDLNLTVTGVTVVVHGYEPFDDEGDQLLPLAEAIRSRAESFGANTNAWLIDIDTNIGGVDPIDSTLPAEVLDPVGHVVLLYDWALQSRNGSAGWAEAAGDGLFAALDELGFIAPASGVGVPMHLIGHGTGAVVVSEAVERMAFYEIPVDHVTYLDPHDFDQGLVVDGAGQLDRAALPDGYGAAVWDNVAFADAYYQTRGANGAGTNGVDVPEVVVPKGRPIPGAYNFLIDDTNHLPAANAYQNLNVFGDHRYLWEGFYLSTVNGTAPESQSGTKDTPAPAQAIPSTLGYAFSQVAEVGVGPNPTRPDPVFYSPPDQGAWQTGTLYHQYDMVEHSGTKYRAIRTHTSQPSDFPNPIDPNTDPDTALWLELTGTPAPQDHTFTDPTLADTDDASAHFGAPNYAGLFGQELTVDGVTNASFAPRVDPFEILNGDFERTGERRTDGSRELPGWASSDEVPPSLVNFPGPVQTDNPTPDPIIAAGRNSLLIATNDEFSLYDREGGVIDILDIDDFYQGIAQLAAQGSVFDPWIMWDQDSERYFIVAIEEDDGLQQANFLVAVSMDADPTDLSAAEWHRYRIPSTVMVGGTLTWGDFEKIGTDEDAVYISANQFAFSNGLYEGALITRLPKSKAMDGTLVDADRTDIIKTFPDAVSILQPVQAFGRDASEPMIFVEAVEAGPKALRGLRVWELDDADNLTEVAFLSAPFRLLDRVGPPIQGAAQPNTSKKLDTLSARLQNAVRHGDSIWTAHTVHVDGSGANRRANVRWYEIAITTDGNGNSYAIRQQDTIDPGAGVHTFVPAINVDRHGNMGISYTQSSSTQFPTMMFASHDADDDLGSTRAGTPVKVSSGSYDDGFVQNRAERWGDYAGLSVDPVDGRTFWVFNQHALFPFEWGTWTGAISFADDPDLAFDPDSNSLRLSDASSRVIHDKVYIPPEATHLVLDKMVVQTDFFESLRVSLGGTELSVDDGGITALGDIDGGFETLRFTIPDELGDTVQSITLEILDEDEAAIGAIVLVDDVRFDGYHYQVRAGDVSFIDLSLIEGGTAFVLNDLNAIALEGEIIKAVDFATSGRFHFIPDLTVGAYPVTFGKGDFDEMTVDGNARRLRISIVEGFSTEGPDSVQIAEGQAVGVGGAADDMDVRRVQQRLRYLDFRGESDAEVVVDADDGNSSATAQAIKLFQAAVDPQGDGDPGDKNGKIVSGDEVHDWLNTEQAPRWIEPRAGLRDRLEIGNETFATHWTIQLIENAVAFRPELLRTGNGDEFGVSALSEYLDIGPVIHPLHEHKAGMDIEWEIDEASIPGSEQDVIDDILAFFSVPGAEMARVWVGGINPDPDYASIRSSLDDLFIPNVMQGPNNHLDFRIDLIPPQVQRVIDADLQTGISEALAFFRDDYASAIVINDDLQAILSAADVSIADHLNLEQMINLGIIAPIQDLFGAFTDPTVGQLQALLDDLAVDYVDVDHNVHVEVEAVVQVNQNEDPFNPSVPLQTLEIDFNMKAVQSGLIDRGELDPNADPPRGDIREPATLLNHLAVAIEMPFEIQLDLDDEVILVSPGADSIPHAPDQTLVTARGIDLSNASSRLGLLELDIANDPTVLAIDLELSFDNLDGEGNLDVDELDDPLLGNKVQSTRLRNEFSAIMPVEINGLDWLDPLREPVVTMTVVDPLTGADPTVDLLDFDEIIENAVTNLSFFDHLNALDIFAVFDQLGNLIAGAAEGLDLPDGLPFVSGDLSTLIDFSSFTGSFSESLLDENDQIVPFDTFQGALEVLRAAGGLAIDEIALRGEESENAVFFDIDLTRDVTVPLADFDFGREEGPFDAAAGLEADLIATIVVDLSIGFAMNDAPGELELTKTELENTLLSDLNGQVGVRTTAPAVADVEVHLHSSSETADTLTTAVIDDLQNLVVPTDMTQAPLNIAANAVVEIVAEGTAWVITDGNLRYRVQKSGPDVFVSNPSWLVDLSGATTVQEAIDTIEAGTGNGTLLSGAVVEDAGVAIGIQWTDSTTSTDDSRFFITRANNSEAGSDIGILGVAKDSDDPDMKIDNTFTTFGPRVGDNSLDRIFLVEGDSIQLSAEIEVDDIDLAASVFGLGAEIVNGTFDLDMTSGVTLTDPGTGVAADQRIYISELVSNPLSDIAAVDTPTLVGTGRLPVVGSDVVNALLGGAIDPNHPNTDAEDGPELQLSIALSGNPATNDITFAPNQDFEDLFNSFSNFEFGSPCQAITGILDMLGDSNLGFFNEPLPVINRSLNEVIDLASTIGPIAEAVCTDPEQVLSALQDLVPDLDSVSAPQGAIPALLDQLDEPLQQQLFDLRERFNEALNAPVASVPTQMLPAVSAFRSFIDSLPDEIDTAQLSHVVDDIEALLPSFDQLEQTIENALGDLVGPDGVTIGFENVNGPRLLFDIPIEIAGGMETLEFSNLNDLTDNIPIQIEGEGNLTLSYGVNLDLDFAVDLSSGVQPLDRLTLATGSDGTKLEVTASIASNNASIAATIGGIEAASLNDIEIALSEATIIGTTGAGTNFTLDMAPGDEDLAFVVVTDGGVADTIRSTEYTLAGTNLTFNNAIPGGATVEVVEVGGSPASLGFFLKDTLGDYVTLAQAPGEIMPDLNAAIGLNTTVDLPIVPDPTDPIRAFSHLNRLSTSHVEFPGLSTALGDNGLGSDACNVDLVAEGIQIFLDGLESALMSDLLEQMPIISSEDLDDVNTFLGNLRSFADPIIEALTGTDELRNYIFENLGPGTNGGTGLKLDILVFDDDNNPNTAPIPLTSIDDIGGAVDSGDNWAVVADGADCIQFDLHIGDVFTIATDFDLGLDGVALNVQTEGGVELELAYDIQIGFGLSKTQGAFFIVDDTAPEISLTAAAQLQDGTELDLELFFLGVTAKEREDDPQDPDPMRDGVNTGITGEVTIQFMEPAGTTMDERVTFAEIGSSSLGELFAPALDLDVFVDLELSAGIGVDDNLPRIEVDFWLNWEIIGDDFMDGDAPDVRFIDLRLDIGQFLKDGILPIAQKINDAIAPLRPVLDALSAPVPLISQISELITGDPILVSDLIAIFGEGFESIQKVIEVIQLVDTVITLFDNFAESGEILFGQYLFGSEDLRIGGDIEADPSKVTADPMGAPTDQADGQPGKIGQAIKRLNELGISIPLLEDPTNAFGLLFGEPVDIILYRGPELRALFRFAPPGIGPLIPPIPLFISFFTELEVFVDILNLGLDTFGIFGGNNFFDGFFLIDEGPVAGLKARFGVEANLNLGLIQAGARGGVEAVIGFGWNDVNDDGKFRTTEVLERLSQGPHCLFELQGSLGVFLEAYGALGIKIFGKTFTIFEIVTTLLEFTILDFNIGCPPLPPPQLAGQSGGTLTVNVGPNAHLRQEGALDGEDDIEIDQDGDTIIIKGFGLEQEFPKDGDPPVTKIVIDGGAEIDTITFSENVMVGADISGGDGDDIIQGAVMGQNTISGGAGNDRLLGGDENDEISGGDGNDEIFGGDGNDTLEGDAGNDTVRGESGDDQVMGGNGEDNLDGGNDNDTIEGGSGDDQANGSNGNDSIVGDGGDDALNGGDGNDTLIGGDGADVLGGGAGSDSMRGGEGDDLLTGDGDDLAEALPGADSLYGDGGSDTLDGGEASDTFFFETASSPEHDAVSDASDNGIDLLDFSGVSDDVTVNLFHGDASHANRHVDIEKPLRFENVTTGDGNDTIIDNQNDNTLTGGAGDDLYVFGRKGTQTDEVVEAPGEGADGIDFTDLPSGTPVTIDLTVIGAVATHTGRTVMGDGPNLENGFGGEDADTITGNASPNILEGNGDDDTIVGGAGGDTIAGGAGNDTLIGEGGPDSITAGAGLDSVLGNSGDDTLLGGADEDTLFGGANDDSIRGGGGNDTILGEAGNDDLSGNGGEDTILGDIGNDTILGGSEADSLLGDAGHDSIEGNSGPDDIYGADGNDTILGGAGEDIIFGEAGNDDIDGGPNRDFIMGDLGDDTARGGSGDDLVSGGGDSGILGGLINPASALEFFVDIEDFGDFLDGGSGHDLVLGSHPLGVVELDYFFLDALVTANFKDMFVDRGLLADDMDETFRTYIRDLMTDSGEDPGGADGDDIVHGGHDNDLLTGEEGTDYLFGDFGNDILFPYRILSVMQTTNDRVEGGPDDDFMCATHGDNYMVGGTSDHNELYITTDPGFPSAGPFPGGYMITSCEADPPVFPDPLPVQIHGQKFEDLNGDGIQDPLEIGLDGWTIELRDPEGALLGSTVTQSVDLNDDGLIDPYTETGLYWFMDITEGGEIEGLVEGTYSVHEVLQDTHKLTFPVVIDNDDSFTVNLPSGQEATAELIATETGVIPGLTVGIESGDAAEGLNFANAPLGEINGLKWENVNGNILREDGEDGVPGVKIYLDLNNDQTLNVGDEPETTTDANGQYRFTGLEPDFYRVREVVPDGDFQGFPFFHAFFLDWGEIEDNRNFNNYTIPLVQGVKFHDLNGNGVKDVGEGGLGGWTIYNDRNNNGILDGLDDFTTTNPDGTYELETVPGVVTLREDLTTQPGWVQSFPDPDGGGGGAYQFLVESGSVVTERDFGNYRPVSILGSKFNDQTNTFIDGWTMYIDENRNGVLDDGEPTSVTALGAWAFSNLKPGNYIIGEVLQEGWIQVAPGPDPETGLPAFNIDLVSDTPSVNNEFRNVEDVDMKGVKFEDIDADGQRDVAEDLNGDGLLNDGIANPLLNEIVDGVDYNGDEDMTDILNEDVDGDGKLDVFEPGLPNWTIYLDNNDNGMFDPPDPLDPEAYSDPFTITAFDDPDTTADESGQYAFAEPAGVYKMREVLQDGWLQITPSAPDFHLLDLSPGEVVDTNIDFGNVRSVVISGVKYNDINGNGQRDFDNANLDAMNEPEPVLEPGLNGWTIELRDENGNLVDMTTTADVDLDGSLTDGIDNDGDWDPLTDDLGANGVDDLEGFEDEGEGDGVPTIGEPNLDANDPDEGIDPDTEVGVYSFSGIEPGTYTLNEIPMAGWTRITPGPDTGFKHTVTIGPGETINDVDFGNAEEIIISGVKFRDDNFNGVQDGVEPGLPGWTIFLDEDFDGVLDVDEDLNGDGKLNNGNGHPLLDEAADGVDYNNDFDMTDFVNEDVDGDARLDTAEQFTVTGAGGIYQFTELPPDTYSVKEVLQPGWFQTFPGEINQSRHLLRPVSGDTVSDAHFGNVNGEGGISGKKWNDLDGDGVRDPGEPGVPGVVIYIDLNGNKMHDSSIEPFTVTDEDGCYHLPVPGAGTWTVREVLPQNTEPTFPFDVVYMNDFEQPPIGSEWSSTQTDFTPTGQQFLGQFANGPVSLTLTGLPMHTHIRVESDVNVIGDWDGNADTPDGPDRFSHTIDGAPVLQTTFANEIFQAAPRKSQAYPLDYPAGNFPPMTGAAETQSLGYGLDSVYRLDYTRMHMGQIIRIDWNGQGLDGPVPGDRDDDYVFDFHRLFGDFDKDRDVDDLDRDVFQATLIKPLADPAYDVRADFLLDDDVDFHDQFFFASRLGSSLAPAAPLDLFANPNPAGPEVLGVVFDQDKVVHEIRIRFSEDVSQSFGPEDVVLQNLTTGSPVPAAAMAISYDLPSNEAIVTFPGLGDGATQGVGLLRDGNYRLRLVAAGITNGAGESLDGNTKLADETWGLDDVKVTLLGLGHTVTVEPGEVVEDLDFGNKGSGPPMARGDGGSFTSSAAMTYVVDTIADTEDFNDGVVTLREAIMSANANSGVDSIHFNLPGPGPHTIALSSSLPPIFEGVNIDGSTQPGWVAGGDPLVMIDGSGVGGDGFNDQGGESTFNALAIGGFDVGIRLAGGVAGTAGSIVSGSRIGTDTTGDTAVPNDTGILISGSTHQVISNQISGNTGRGVLVSGGSTNTITGNRIGTNALGTAALGNGTGVVISGGFGNTLGAPFAGNTISGNFLGVLINQAASDTVVRGNRIGTDANGTIPIGNTTDGIRVIGSGRNATRNTRIGGTAPGAGNLVAANQADGIVLQGSAVGGTLVLNNVIGSTDPSLIPGNALSGVRLLSLGTDSGPSATRIGGEIAGEGNTIAHNGADGVTVVDGVGNAILMNAIFGNGDIAIDLNDDGPTPNDPPDLDVGPNNLQNFPQITLVQFIGPNVEIFGTLQTQPFRTYRVELFNGTTSAAPGNEAEVFMGSVPVFTDQTGFASFVAVLSSDPVVGDLFTATATDELSSDTSELSPSFTTAADGTIQGEKWHDLDGNGQKGEFEPPLGGVTIYLDANDNGELDPGETSTITNAEGDYSFPSVPPGHHVVREVVPSGFIPTFPIDASGLPAHHATLLPDQTLNLNFGNVGSGSIHGTKFNDLDGNGIDAGDPPMPGVTIFLDDNNNGVLDPGEQWTVTDAQGRYWFMDLAPGVYIVNEIIPDGFQQTVPAPGNGALFTFNGMVTDVQGQLGAPFSQVQPGALWELSYSFDSARADVDPSPGRGHYPAVTGATLTMAGATASEPINPATSVIEAVDQVTILDDFNLPPFNSVTLLQPAPAVGSSNANPAVGALGSMREISADKVTGADGTRLVAGIDERVGTFDYESDQQVAGVATVRWDGGAEGQFNPIGLGGIDLSFDSLEVAVKESTGAQGANLRFRFYWFVDTSGISFAEATVFVPGTIDAPTVLSIPKASFTVQSPINPALTVDDVLKNVGAADMTLDASAPGASGFDVWIDEARLVRSAPPDVYNATAPLGLPPASSSWTINLEDPTATALDSDALPVQLDIFDFENRTFTYFDSGVSFVKGSIDGHSRQRLATGRQVTLSSQQMLEGIDFANRLKPTMIHGVKWHDLDGDGMRDKDEPGTPGVTIYVDLNGDGMFDPTSEPSTTTMQDNPSTQPDETGHYWLTVSLPAGTYDVHEVLPAGFGQSFPADGAPHTIDIEPGDSVHDIDFGNFSPATLEGTKYDDHDCDGVYPPEALDTPREGVTIYLDLNNNNMLDLDLITFQPLEPTTVTDANGQYSFTVAPGQYIVREVLDEGFVQSYPDPENALLGGHQVTVVSGQTASGLDFLNYDLEPVPDGQDSIFGSLGNDRVFGDNLLTNPCIISIGHDDFLYGEEGNDTMAGQLRNDTYFFEPASTTAGNDWMDTVIELEGEGTNERTDEGIFDRLDFSALPDTEPVTVDMAGGFVPVIKIAEYTNGTATQEVFVDVVANRDYIEQVLGGDGDDDITGNAADNWLNGGPGSDTLAGDSGDDQYVIEAHDPTDVDEVVETAAGDTDTLDFSTATDDLVVDLSAAGTIATFSSGPSVTSPTPESFENVLTGTGNDDIVANDANNLIMAGGGNDTIDGGLGDDTMHGNTGDDVYKFSDGWDLDDVIELVGEGDDTMDFSMVVNPVTAVIGSIVVTDDVDPTNVATHTEQNVENLVGSIGGMTVVAADAANTWIIDGLNSGTLNGVNFSDTPNLVGGALTDDFIFQVGGQITGNISGGDGIDTVDLTLGGSIGGTYDGGNDDDVLIGPAAVTNWSLVGVDTGSVAGAVTSFADVQNLTGGSDADTFDLSVGGSGVPGAIDGGAGADILIGPNAAQAWTLTGPDAGTAGATAFSNIENLTGGTDQDTFTLGAGGSLSGTADGGAGSDAILGPDALTTWNVTGAGTGSVPALLGGFSNIENLTGGNATDTFDFSGGGSIAGGVVGGAGADAIIGPSAVTTWNILVPDQGDVPGVVGAFSNIENLTGGGDQDTFDFGLAGNLSGNVDGGAGSDTILGPDAAAVTWNLTTNDGGNAPGVVAGFSNVENLTGATTGDTFVFSDGVVMSGAIDGGSLPGLDTLDYNAYTTAVTVDLNAGTATGVLGGISDIENVTGGSDADALTGDANDNVLRGGAGADTLNGLGGNDTLNGGDDDDVFSFADAWGVDTIDETAGGG
ncbi:MAG: hypothetical protein CMJ18_05815, partial [Phycisphaeraceae bacterium]|nr:hypothetical protein [Phycisphaeraceae bacterium]